MNSTLDNSQLNVFSAFIQLLNWKQVDSIVDEQPEEGTVAAVITTRSGGSISGYEGHTFTDRSGNKYRAFDIKATGQAGFVSEVDGVLRVAVVSNKQFNDFMAFAQTLDSEE